MTEQDQNKLLLVLTGPSGVGKDAVLGKLATQIPLARIVTWTDRPPKPNEIEGVHYHFITTPEFHAKIDRGEFLEWVEYGADRDRGIPGTFKGTTKRSLYPPHDQHLVWRIDPSRAATIKSTFIDALGEGEAMALLARTLVIYLTVESIAELINRQIQRDGHKNQARIDHDLKIWQEFSSVFKNVVTNRSGQIDQTVSEIIRLMSTPQRTEI